LAREICPVVVLKVRPAGRPTWLYEELLGLDTYVRVGALFAPLVKFKVVGETVNVGVVGTYGCESAAPTKVFVPLSTTLAVTTTV
jgi:hypothetical protein